MKKPEATPWLDLARADIGKREIEGPKHNPDILACFADCGHPEIDADEIAWCAAQQGSWLVRTGYPIPPRAHNLMARSYLTYGQRLERPRVGCIAVLKRGKPPFGHVGTVDEIDEVNRKLRIIGGNQGDKVSRQWFPMADVLPGGYRWPVKATIEDLKAAGSTEIASSENARTAIAAGGAVTGLVKGAQDVVQPDTASWLPQVSVESAADQATNLQVLTEAAHAVAKLVLDNLWILSALGVAALIYWLLGRQSRARVARAARGAPLSSQLAATEAEDAVA